jgi:hypothetical protein
VLYNDIIAKTISSHDDDPILYEVRTVSDASVMASGRLSRDQS